MSLNESGSFMYEILDVYIQAPLCFVGFVLNLINFSIFVQQNFFAAPYVLLTAMSFMDSITLLLRIFEAVARCSSFPVCKNPYLQMVVYLIAVFVEVPITNITESISNWTAVALATERYIAMCHYNLSKQYSTVFNARLFIACATLASIILNVPFFYINQVKIEWENTTDHDGLVPVIYSSFSKLATSNFYIFHAWLRPLVVKVIPLVFLCMCNFLLLTLVYQHGKKLERMHIVRSEYITSKATKIHQRKQRAQNKLTILLIVVIILFLIGQIPVTFSYLKIYEKLPNHCAHYQYLSDCPNYKLFSSISHLLMITCYCTNFFVYLGLNNHFRNCLLRSMAKCCCHFHCCWINRTLIMNDTDIAINSILLHSTGFIPGNISSNISSNSPRLSNKEVHVSPHTLHPSSCLKGYENTSDTYVYSRSSFDRD